MRTPYYHPLYYYSQSADAVDYLVLNGPPVLLNSATLAFKAVMAVSVVLINLYPYEGHVPSLLPVDLSRISLQMFTGFRIGGFHGLAPAYHVPQFFTMRALWLRQLLAWVVVHSSQTEVQLTLRLQ